MHCLVPRDIPPTIGELSISADRAHSPARNGDFSETRTGVGCIIVVVPLPNMPVLPFPQHRAFPLRASAHTVVRIRLTDPGLREERHFPVTRTGLLLQSKFPLPGVLHCSDALPIPSVPSIFPPQHCTPFVLDAQTAKAPFASAASFTSTGKTSG